MESFNTYALKSFLTLLVLTVLLVFFLLPLPNLLDSGPVWMVVGILISLGLILAAINVVSRIWRKS